MYNYVLSHNVEWVFCQDCNSPDVVHQHAVTSTRFTINQKYIRHIPDVYSVLLSFAPVESHVPPPEIAQFIKPQHITEWLELLPRIISAPLPSTLHSVRGWCLFMSLSSRDSSKVGYAIDCQPSGFGRIMQVIADENGFITLNLLPKGMLLDLGLVEEYVTR
jgi:hypothetical protein